MPAGMKSWPSVCIATSGAMPTASPSTKNFPVIVPLPDWAPYTQRASRPW